LLALVDGDILLYESAFAGQDKETGEIHSFDYVREIFDEKLATICRAVEADSSHIYLTGDNNFRLTIAKTKPYKGTRHEEKPWHYENLRAYLSALPNVTITDGYEADDAMCIEQCKRLEAKDTIICSRDKDLRMCPGFHYGWEHGNQPEFFPEWVDRIGNIELAEKFSEVTQKTTKKIKGTGLKFFYSQLITGDTVDNIPGLPKAGPVVAFDNLNGCNTDGDMYKCVSQLYQGKLGDNWEEYLSEQAQLLWMVQELDENNNPVHWRPPVDNPSNARPSNTI